MPLEGKSGNLACVPIEAIGILDRPVRRQRQQHLRIDGPETISPRRPICLFTGPQTIRCFKAAALADPPASAPNGSGSDMRHPGSGRCCISHE